MQSLAHGGCHVTAIASASYTEAISSRKVISGAYKIDGYRGSPGGAVVKNPPANAGDTGLSPGPGRSHMPRSN